jgi:hypothetical protein
MEIETDHTTSTFWILEREMARGLCQYTYCLQIRIIVTDKKLEMLPICFLTVLFRS